MPTATLSWLTPSASGLLRMIVVALGLVLAPDASAATITVNTLSDENNTDGDCSLREALRSANLNMAVDACVAGEAGADTVVFDATLAATGGTVILTLGSLLISDPVTLDGTIVGGFEQVTLDAGGPTRVLTIAPSAGDVTLRNLTATDGFSTVGGAIGISAGVDVTLDNVTVSNSTASVSGGGVYSEGGALTITGSTFVGNEAAGDAATDGGGSVYVASGTLDIDDSAFRASQATGASGSGGALFILDGTATVDNSAISANTASRAGGGIEIVDGSLTLTGVDLGVSGKLGGNEAGPNPGNGGGLHVSGTASVTVEGGTVSGNLAALEGGGLWNQAGATMTINGTTFTSNEAQGDAGDDGGGALFNNGGTMIISGASITSNMATGDAGSGGGILTDGGTLSISGGMISSNTANRAGAGIEVNASAVTINGATLSENVLGAAPGNGGALHIGGDGSVVMDSSAVWANVAGGEGGGLWNSAAGTLTVRATTVMGNSALATGGIHNDGDGGSIFVERSTVAGNTSTNGTGGLFSEGGTLAVTNSTVSGNTGDIGGGFWTTGGEALLNSVTIARNTSATSGGGIANGGATVSLINTILGDNTAPNGADCAGTLTSEDYNLIEDTAACAVEGDVDNTRTGVDPLLDVLGDNGGPTETHALLDNSPALSAGLAMLTVDQRGVEREEGTADIGAFESDKAPVANESDAVAMPDGYLFDSVYPNPLRDRATLRFGVREAQEVEVALYDVLGKQVAVLHHSTLAAGQVQAVQISAAGLASGLYFVRLTGKHVQATRRLSIVR